MKQLARLLGFAVIGLFFVGIFIDLMQYNVRMNELIQATSTAINQTQIVMREQIEDKYYNYSNARVYFDNNDDYIGYFRDCLKKLITSDSKYSFDVYGIDYEKGLISVGVNARYIKINGEEKILHTRKTSIVDVILNGDTGGTIPATDVTIVNQPSLRPSFEYDGTEHYMVNAGVISGGIFHYGYSNSNSEVPSNYQTTIPKIQNAGNYYVWYKVENLNSHEFTNETCIGQLVVNKRPVNVHWGEDTWDYTGEAHQTTVALTNVLPMDLVSVNISNNSITDAGTKEAIITEVYNPNYRVIDSEKTHTLTVNKLPIEVNVTAKTMTYGDSPDFEYTSEILPGDVFTGTALYSVKTLSGTSVPDVAHADVGTYEISLSGLINGNYDIHYNTARLTIEQKKDYLTFGHALTKTMEEGNIVNFTVDAASNSVGTLSYTILAQEDGAGNPVSYFSHSGLTIEIDDAIPADLYTVFFEASCTGDTNHRAETVTMRMDIEITAAP